MAVNKSEEDNIPLYGWMDDGWLTMCNSPTVNVADIVNWFIDMRKMGFKINKSDMTESSPARNTSHR